MRRSQTLVDGSLELLLDTITNTFGSVLFITMLVAFLLRASERSVVDEPAMTKAAQVRAEAVAIELSIEIDHLTETLAALPPTDPEVAAVESAIAAVTEEVARSIKEEIGIGRETVAVQERVAGICAEADRLRRELASAEQRAEKEAGRRKQAEEDAARLAALAVELDRPVDPRQIVQVATLPEISSTSKEQFGVLMRYGRIYVMHQRDANGHRIGPNARDFMVTLRPDGRQLARARPDAGRIADGTSVEQAMREILRPYPADKWVVAIIVNEDSFGQFQAVKAALVGLGYQYDPISIREDNGVWDSGGTEKRGQ